MSSKKIAIIVPTLTKKGGLEKYSLRLAQGFKDQGNLVTLITAEVNSMVYPILPGTCVRLGKGSSITLLRLLQFNMRVKKYLAKNPHDIVFGMDRSLCPQTHHRAGNGVHAAYLDHRKKVSSWLKGLSFTYNPQHRMMLQMERSTFENPALKTLFTNSYMVKKEVIQYYPGVQEDKICVVHNGVEWNELEKPFEESLVARETILQSFGLSPKAYQFLFVGNEYGRKGLNILLQALSLLPGHNFQLSVVGVERNPEQFINQAKQLGIYEQVRFFGGVKDTKRFYQLADCLVVPSLYDPFANVTVEALAMGLYVISSIFNGGHEVITSNDMGTVFKDVINPQELAGCLLHALKKPKTAESSRHIRNTVRHLDFSNQISKTVQVTLQG